MFWYYITKTGDETAEGEYDTKTPSIRFKVLLSQTVNIYEILFNLLLFPNLFVVI